MPDGSDKFGGHDSGVCHCFLRFASRCLPRLGSLALYVGGGNTLWTPADYEYHFPKRYIGSVRCFSLPGEDEVDRIGRGNKK